MLGSNFFDLYHINVIGFLSLGEMSATTNQ